MDAVDAARVFLTYSWRHPKTIISDLTRVALAEILEDHDTDKDQVDLKSRRTRTGSGGRTGPRRSRTARLPPPDTDAARRPQAWKMVLSPSAIDGTRRRESGGPHDPVADSVSADAVAPGPTVGVGRRPLPAE